MAKKQLSFIVIDSTSTSDQNKVTDASLTSSQTIHPGATPPPIVLPTQATAIFGAGCYWSVELAFQRSTSLEPREVFGLRDPKSYFGVFHLCVV